MSTAARHAPAPSLRIPVSPVDWALGMANVLSLGVSSQLLAPFQEWIDRLPLRGVEIDPLQLLDRAVSGIAPALEVAGPSITATPEQIRAIDAMPDVKPVYALNLLRFKPDGGAEKFADYVQASLKGVERIGGRLLFNGAGVATAIGPDHWDDVGLLEYPSLRAFSNFFFHDPEMQKLERTRAEALEDSRLYLFAAAPT